MTQAQWLPDCDWNDGDDTAHSHLITPQLHFQFPSENEGSNESEESCDDFYLIAQNARKLAEHATQQINEHLISAYAGEYWKLGCLGLRDRDEERQKWKRAGILGAAVLMRKATHETDVERLSEIAAILSSSDPEFLLFYLEIVSTLSTPNPEFVETIFKAISWDDKPLDEASLMIFEKALASWRTSSDSGVRLALYNAALRLPKPDAIKFLEDARDNEGDQDLLDEIDDNLSELRF